MSKLAEGEDRYFPRPYLTKKICRAISNGENILLSAPRRIGKSSLLKAIKSNSCAGSESLIYKYMIIQSIESSESFFKKLFNELINDEAIFNGIDGHTKRLSYNIKNIVSRLRGISLEGGVQIDANNGIDYYKECEVLLTHLKDKKLVLFIDEFPDALNNIDKIDRNMAIHFLQQHRDLRQKFSLKNLQFVYTGSTGLRNLVNKIGKPDLINDLNEIKVPPFSRDEANCLIQSLVLGYQQENENFELTLKQIDYILNKITWYLPYYLQSIVYGLFDSFEDKNNVNAVTSINDIDEVFLEMSKFKSIYSPYFENSLYRLKKVLDENDHQTAINILNYIAVHDSISKEKLKEIIATLSDGKDHIILNTLKYDGYINENNQFNCILLKNWWLKNVVN